MQKPLMQKPLSPRPVALATVLSLTVLVACTAGGSRASNELVLVSPAPNSLFTFNEVIARELGFYAEEGITVELAAATDAIPVAGLIENGTADIGLVAASDALAAGAQSDALRLAYDERTGGTGFLVGIVVPESSDVDDIADLAGRNVGLASPDQDRALLASALEEAGLGLDAVETTVVGAGGPAVAESLRSGRIAAFTGTLTDFAAFGDAGLPVRDVTPEGLEGLPLGGYVVRAEDLGQGEDLVKFFRSLAKGTYVAIERPQVTEALTRQVAPEQWREPDVAEGLLEGLTASLRPLDGTTFGEIRPERWANAQDLLLQTGAMERAADLDALLASSDVLAEVNDWDRAAVLAQADRWLAEHGGN